jgi:F-type H+-transporting ATPase subunit b
MSSLHSLASILSSAICGAAEEHAGGVTHMTSGDSKRLIYHTLDLALLFGGLYYLTHAKIKAFFAGRGKKFDLAVQEAQRARAEAEQHNAQIKMKLKKLEDSASLAIDKAQKDALLIKQEIVAEGHRVADRMAEESESTIHVEFERAIFQLKQEFAASSIDQARAIMTATVGEKEQKKLERDFIEKIQVR